MSDPSFTLPYESIDPRVWYPNVLQTVGLDTACREYLAAVEFGDSILRDDPREPEASRRVLECAVNVLVAAAAHLAMDITPYELGRKVAYLFAEHQRHDAAPPDQLAEDRPRQA